MGNNCPWSEPSFTTSSPTMIWVAVSVENCAFNAGRKPPSAIPSTGSGQASLPVRPGRWSRRALSCGLLPFAFWLPPFDKLRASPLAVGGALQQYVHGVPGLLSLGLLVYACPPRADLLLYLVPIFLCRLRLPPGIFPAFRHGGTTPPQHSPALSCRLALPVRNPPVPVVSSSPNAK